MGTRGKNLKQTKSRTQDKKNQDGKNISSMIGLDKYKVFVLIIGK